MNWLGLSRPVSARVLPLVAILSLFAAPSGAVDRVHVANPEGPTELAFTQPNGRAVRATVSQAKLTNNYPYTVALLWGGDEGELPHIVLTSIQIRDGDDAMVIPLSAYSDLGDVTGVSIGPTAKGFSLRIHGGRTATSYDVVLTFEHGWLVTRTVALREFPDQRLETTRYKFPKRPS